MPIVGACPSAVARSAAAALDSDAVWVQPGREHVHLARQCQPCFGVHSISRQLPFKLCRSALHIQSRLGARHPDHASGARTGRTPTRDRFKLIPRVANVEAWAADAPLSSAEYRLLLNYNDKPLLTRPQHKVKSLPAKPQPCDAVALFLAREGSLAAVTNTSTHRTSHTICLCLVQWQGPGPLTRVEPKRSVLGWGHQQRPHKRLPVTDRSEGALAGCSSSWLPT